MAAYGFNEGAGAVVNDTSGQGNGGTITGATWTTAGRYGAGLSFNGTNSWVTVPSKASLNLTNGMTLMAWVNPSTATGVQDVLIKEGTGADLYNLYARNWRGRPESNVLVGGTNRAAEGSSLPTNTWSHLAGTYDGGTLRFFLNGVQVASTGVAGPIATSTGVVRIGGNSLWGEYFRGTIDEVRVYNRALSGSEIQGAMNTGVGAAPLPASVTLTVAKAGSGTGTVTGPGISCGTDCTQAVSGGTAVPLAAAPGAGSTFAGWSGGGCTGTGPCTVSLVANTTVTATFTQPTASVTGLVAAYGFNEGAGAVVNDTSGQGNGGTITGATWTTAGRYGAGLSFNGTNSWVTVPSKASLNLTNGMTLMAWVNPSTRPGSRTS